MLNPPSHTGLLALLSKRSQQLERTAEMSLPRYAAETRRRESESSGDLQLPDASGVVAAMLVRRVFECLEHQRE